MASQSFPTDLETLLCRTSSALELWWGDIPSTARAEAEVGSSPASRLTAQGDGTCSEEPTCVVRSMAHVKKTRCSGRDHGSHMFGFARPLPRNLADLGVCIRCGLSALIEPSGRTTALHARRRPVFDWVLLLCVT